MNKEDKDSSVDWTYSGKEEEWDGFDRRMTRYMRNKLDSFGEKLWQGQVGNVEDFNQQELWQSFGHLLLASDLLPL